MESFKLLGGSSNINQQFSLIHKHLFYAHTVPGTRYWECKEEQDMYLKLEEHLYSPNLKFYIKFFVYQAKLENIA